MWSIRNERLTTKKRGEGFFFLLCTLRYHCQDVRWGSPASDLLPFPAAGKILLEFFFFRYSKGRDREVHCHCQNVPATSQGEKIRIRSSRADDVEGEFDGKNGVAIFNFFIFSPAACEGSFLGGKVSILLHFPTHSMTACDLNA
jgi:hypothetical protein